MEDCIRSSELTVGIDLGDRVSRLCVLDGTGEVIEEGRVATRPEALRARFSATQRMRIVLETGTHAPWVSRLLEALGHEVYVANARHMALISKSDSKSDRIDAEMLARVGRSDPKLLRAVRPRRAETMASLALLRSREALVRARSALVNHARGTVKAAGGRLPAVSTEAFARRVLPHVPAEVGDAVAPVLDQIAALTTAIAAYDRRIGRMARDAHPETKVLRQVTGVGPLTALTYVLTLEDPHRFRTSRAVGSYLGLRPKRSQSGERDPQLRITKAGDRALRGLLVQAAHYILGPFGPDCDLRRFGQRLAERGGKAAKKRATVAVARKLAVLLHRLWITGEQYEPVRQGAAVASAAA